MAEKKDPGVAGLYLTGHLSQKSRQELVLLARRQELKNERARFRRAISVTIRDNLPPEEIFVWLRSVAAGKDPDSDAPGHAPIDWSVRMKAMITLLERAYGLPAQHIHVEAEMRQQVSVAAVNATAEDWKRLPPDRLKEFRDTLRELTRPVVSRSIDVGEEPEGED